MEDTKYIFKTELNRVGNQYKTDNLLIGMDSKPSDTNSVFRERLMQMLSDGLWIIQKKPGSDSYFIVCDEIKD